MHLLMAIEKLLSEQKSMIKPGFVVYSS